MTTQNNPRFYLDDLCKRWSKSADDIVEMAIDGEVELWMIFLNVFLWKSGGTKRKKPPMPQLHEEIEVRLQAEVLRQMLGRCERILIGAEFSCLDDKNKAVMVSNSVGDEWGATSMLGIKPASLFAHLADVVRFERKNSISLPAGMVDLIQLGHPVNDKTLPTDLKNHPCFAPELYAADNCWAALFAEARTAETVIKKADILAWLREHYPELSKSAIKRVAKVVMPAKNGR